MNKRTTIKKRRRQFLFGSIIILAIALTSCAVYGAKLLTQTKQTIDHSFQQLKEMKELKNHFQRKIHSLFY